MENRQKDYNDDNSLARGRKRKRTRRRVSGARKARSVYDCMHRARAVINGESRILTKGITRGGGAAAAAASE